jgi:hypothetical protein
MEALLQGEYLHQGPHAIASTWPADTTGAHDLPLKFEREKVHINRCPLLNHVYTIVFVCAVKVVPSHEGVVFLRLACVSVCLYVCTISPCHMYLYLDW